MDIKYVAGFFDADGYVGVSDWRNGQSYTLKCTIVNIKLRVLEEIHRLFGGYLTTKGYADGNRRILYQLQWNSKQTVEFLEKIYPYLIVKKSQVRLALSFPTGKHGKKRSDWMIEKQREIYEELKLIKAVIDPPNMKYANSQEIEHQEMLRKKQLAIQLKKKNPSLSMKEIGEKVGVSATMVCNYVRRV